MIAASLIASTAAAKAPVPVYFDFAPYQITPKRPVEIRRDPSGELVVLVQLTKDRTAVTTLAAFIGLMEAGISPNWFSNGNGRGGVYVCAERQKAIGGNPVMVSRLLLVPPHRALVARYRDRNPFNLRPDNLYLEARASRAKLKETEVFARDA